MAKRQADNNEGIYKKNYFKFLVTLYVFYQFTKLPYYCGTSCMYMY